MDPTWIVGALEHVKIQHKKKIYGGIWNVESLTYHSKVWSGV
jgi:hypothetical protein